MFRPTVAVVITLAGCAMGGAPEGENDQLLGGNRLRVMAANTTSGNGQSYDEGHGIRIFQGAKPDIALVQEMRYTAGDRAFVDTAFGTTFEFVKGAGNIPNGVVSRYPIIESGEWDDPQVSDRGFTWARIDVPGPIDLWAVSLHLLTKSSTARDSEARVIRSHIQSVVPDDAWLVIGGDFNTDSRSEAAIKTFASVVVTQSPYPADHHGNGNTNASRAKPYDWVLVDDGLDAREIPVEIGGSSFSHGLVIDTRVYSPISELSPARTSDSAASAMQHMAVVRDFDIPAEDTTNPSVVVNAPNGGEQWAAGSTQTIVWTATDLSTVDIQYAADGVTFTTIASGLTATAGSFDWTVPSTPTTTGTIRIVAPDGSAIDDSDATFEIVAPPQPTGGVIINEVLSNEPGTTTSGEFVEIVNASNATADLSGWTLSDGVSQRHVFAAGTMLAAGARLVVSASAASTGALGLSNSGDSVTLGDASGNVVDRVSFLSAPDGVSFNRSPDGTTGPLVLHTQLSSQPSSAGAAPGGAAAP